MWGWGGGKYQLGTSGSGVDSVAFVSRRLFGLTPHLDSLRVIVQEEGWRKGREQGRNCWRCDLRGKGVCFPAGKISLFCGQGCVTVSALSILNEDVFLYIRVAFLFCQYWEKEAVA